ncbi:hypothetical protein SAMN05444920_106469, partial [Nonomuraea solani]
SVENSNLPRSEGTSPYFTTHPSDFPPWIQAESGDNINPDRLLREHLQLLRRDANGGRGMSLRAVEHRLKIKRSTFHSWLQEDGPIPTWKQLEPIVELLGGDKDQVRVLREAAISHRERRHPSTQAVQSSAIASSRSDVQDCSDPNIAEAAPISVSRNGREPSQGELQMGEKRSKFMTAMGLIVAFAGLFLISGSGARLMGVSGPLPAVEAAVASRQAIKPMPSAKSNPTIEFLKKKADHASSEAQAVQAEIEALAAAQMPGDRSKIVERIRELSWKKSALEVEVGYLRRAIRQMTD